MRKIILFVLIVLLSSAFRVALSTPRFQFSSDYTVFKYNNKYIIEVYCSFYQKGLKYEYIDGYFEGAGLLDISIMDKRSNDIYYSVLNKVPSKEKDTTGTNIEQRIIVQKNIPIIPGEFILKIFGKDFNDTLSCDSTILDLTIPEINENPQITGIQLSSSIVKSDNKESNFYKYGFEVVPNPSMLFGNKMNKLFYYYEIYGFKPDLISEAFTITSEIENNNREIIDRKVKKIKKATDLMIDYDSYAIDSFSTGSYYLVVNIKDSIKGYDLKNEKKFYVYNSSSQTDISKGGDADFLRSEYAVMKEDQITNEYEKSIYIRTSQETENYEILKTVDEKRKYIYNFWKTRNTNPASNKNEFKIQYFTRVAEANATFKESFLEGWKTDRGRIYIIYGKPNDIEKFPYEAGTKSYEIWHYNETEGGKLCIFIELQQSGSGIYNLVHSTLRNELKNDNWKEILKK